MVSGAHAKKFYLEVASNDFVWMLGGPSGNPVTVLSNGARVFPLWSSRTRIEKIIQTVDGYSQCVVLGNSWTDFEEMWAPHLASDGVLVGVNWSGSNATGYEMAVELVVDAVRNTRESLAK